ncbi:hypothetical protein AEGHOMDF_3345 [Methylobacterium soli]|nr:hypothetical protein AEGHOMDF_3345 [Methylobacterium soli]
MLDLRDRHLGGGGHHRVEVARGQPVGEVALGVAPVGVDEGEVGEEAPLHHVLRAVELAHLLALGHLGADAGLGEEGRDAGASGADALGQRALRVELDLELVGQELAGEFLVLADIGRDHLGDLSGVEELAEADAVDPGIVRDDGQALHARFAHRVDQLVRNAAEAEAAAHHRHVVAQQARQGGRRIGVNFLHSTRPSRTVFRRIPSSDGHSALPDRSRKARSCT